MIPTCDTGAFMGAIDRFVEMKVLVIGDVILDEYIWGTVRRISPEAPVPVVNVTREEQLLGGAANVIHNIITAGGQAVLTGVIGQDRMGRAIVRMLGKLGSDPSGLVVDKGRPTTKKTRIVAHAQQVVRFDREQAADLDERLQEKMLDFARSGLDGLDAVIISDYGKGVVSPSFMAGLRTILDGKDKLVAVDPQVGHYPLYRGMTLITPNHFQAEAGAGIRIDSEERLIEAGRKLMRELKLRFVVVTRGEEGMTLFEKRKPPVTIPPEAREVFDVSGAGDTVIAILTLGLAAGLSLTEAAVLSNYAAGIVCGKLGTASVTAEELKAAVESGAARAGVRRRILR
jgi:D-beta-D-heptose 7-phosphate kinase/D-beta-D-heptose 1-phosphate adenosyltransferase